MRAQHCWLLSMVLMVTSLGVSLKGRLDFLLVLDIARLCSHWSSSYMTDCALIGRELHSDATPALLCHKEPAQTTQTPY